MFYACLSEEVRRRIKDRILIDFEAGCGNLGRGNLDEVFVPVEDGFVAEFEGVGDGGFVFEDFEEGLRGGLEGWAGGAFAFSGEDFLDHGEDCENEAEAGGAGLFGD